MEKSNFQMEDDANLVHSNFSHSKLLPTLNLNSIEKSVIEIRQNESKNLKNESLKQLDGDNIYYDEPEKSWCSRQFFVQLGIVFTAGLLMFTTGMHIGWVGPTILKLSANDSEIPLTTEEISWLASMVPFGGGIGPIFGAILANKIGRKTTILVTTIPEIFTWIALIFAKDVYCLCIAQLVRGITGGCAYAVLPMYVGEISSPKFRGAMGMLFFLQHHAGMLFEVVLVPYVSVSFNALIALTVPLFLVIIFIWMPESPYYFLMKNQTQNAGKSLRILKQCDNIDKQLEHLRRIVQDEQKEMKNFKEIFRARNNRVSFILCMGVMTIQHITGIFPVMVYSQLLLEKSNSSLDPHTGGIIIAGFGTIGLLMGCVLIDVYGRRPLMMFSIFGSIIPLFIIAIYFHLESLNYEHVNSFSFCPLIGLISMHLISFMALYNIPFLFIGETFSTNFKAFASLFITCYGSFVHSGLSKIYPSLCVTIGIHNVYYLMILGCLVSGIGTYFLVPETKGKTLHEIQQLLKNY